MTTLELHDIQGILRRGYGDMHHAAFVLLRVIDTDEARRSVGALAARVTNGWDKPLEGRLNVAFTHPGLAALGVGDAVLDRFSRAFREGMVTPHRSRVLGDWGTSAPERWAWGREPGAVHAVLLLYAPTADRLAAMVAACPGGNISNIMTHLAGGNTALSIGMTAVSTAAAIIMTACC